MLHRLTCEDNGENSEGTAFGLLTRDNDVKYSERPEVKAKAFFVMDKENGGVAKQSSRITKILEDRPRRVRFQDNSGHTWRWDILETTNPEAKKA